MENVMKKMLIAIPFLTVGCAEIDKLKEDISNITNDFVVSSFYIGTEEFSDERIDLSGISEMQGSQIMTYLVSAEVMDGSEPAPVALADVTFSSDVGTAITLGEDAGGAYSANNTDGLAYTPNEFATLTAEKDGETHVIAVTAPPAPTFDVAETHPLNTELSIDISNQGFDNALVFVAHFPSGEIVYSNNPSDFTELYNFAYPDETATTVGVTIPADSFSEEGLYVISLGGVVAGDEADMDNVNTALSSFLATQMGFDVVCVPECIPMTQN